MWTQYKRLYNMSQRPVVFIIGRVQMMMGTIIISVIGYKLNYCGFFAKLSSNKHPLHHRFRSSEIQNNVSNGHISSKNMEGKFNILYFIISLKMFFKQTKRISSCHLGVPKCKSSYHNIKSLTTYEYASKLFV